MKLPSEYENILSRFASEPADIRETWRFGMIAMLIADGKMRIDSGIWNGQDLQLTVLTKTAESFKVVRPPISMEAEALLVEQTRLLVASAG